MGQSTPLEKAAERLVDTAFNNAVMLYMKVAEHEPKVLEIDQEHWDFINTIAGVFVANTRLGNLIRRGVIPQQVEDTLLQIVVEKLVDKYPDGIEAFEDCRGLFDQMYDTMEAAPEYQGEGSHRISADALGVWIAWNLLDRNDPSNDEAIRKLISLCGTAVTHFFFDYWNEDNWRDQQD